MTTPSIMKAPTPRHRFQLSLRTLMLLVTLICAECAFVGYQLNWIRERRAAYDFERFGEMAVRVWPETDAPSFLWAFGESGVPELWCEKDTPENLAALRRVFPEARVHEWPDDPDVHLSRIDVFRISNKPIAGLAPPE